MKTKGPFTLDLEKVFVPLRLDPKSAEDISPAMVQKAREEKRNLQIWDFLANTDHPAYRTIAVIAAPGAGKTTLLEHLALIYAKNAQRRFHREAPKLIPILLYLRDVRKAIAVEEPPTLAELATQRIAEKVIAQLPLLTF